MLAAALSSAPTYSMRQIRCSTFAAADVNIALNLQPATEPAPEVEYVWDPDTEILSARLRGVAGDRGMSGSIEVEGTDGSWLVFDVSSGTISGLEVAVWPEVHKRSTLTPPAKVEEARVLLPSRVSQPEIAAVEMDTAVMAESDVAQTMIHFTLGGSRNTRVVRLGRDLLLEVDIKQRLVGVWMLNVPPVPEPA